MGAVKDLRRKAHATGQKLQSLIDNRQDVINPYEDVTSLAGMISNPYANMTNTYADLTNPFANMSNAYANVTNAYADMSNPYANLQVATMAADMANEQTDISLASALDTLRATGSGAGGATALAREAAASKQSIAAGIEQQEMRNNELRAQGEAQRQQMIAQGSMQQQMAQAQGAMNVQQMAAQGQYNLMMAQAGAGMEIQNMAAAGEMQTMGMRLAEAERIQNAGVLGKTFMFNAQEQRDAAEMSRLSGLQSQYAQGAVDLKQANRQLVGDFIGAAGSILGGPVGGKIFGD